MRFLKISLAILFTGLFISLFGSSHVNAQSLPNISINELNIQVYEDITGYLSSSRTYADVSQNWFNYFTLENYSEVYNTDYVGVYEKLLNFDNDVDIHAIEDLRDTLTTSYGYSVLYEEYNHSTTIFAHLEPDTKSSIRNYCTSNSCSHYLAFDKDVFRIQIRPVSNRYRPYNIVKTDLVSPTDTDQHRNTFATIGLSGDYDIYKNIFFSNTEFDPTQSIAPWDGVTEPPFNVENIYQSPSEPDENLYPEYEYKVQKSDVGMAYHGELTIKYLKNLPHFLTGISTINVSQMTNNWGEIDTQIDSTTVNPAGHLGQMDELGVKYSLDELNPGYYMIQITHNQQLDSPPWPENASEKYYVYPVYMQFHWDGQNAVINDNIGCTDICNPQLDEKNKYERYFDTIGLPVGGLQEVILAPLAFIEQLPRGHENCEPVFLPLPNNIGMIMLPCMTPIYQQHYNSVFVIYQTILTGLFAYYVSIRMFGNVKELANPKDDGIEAVRL